MHARMVTLEAHPGQGDALAAFWDDAVVAEITAQTGNRGFFLLADPSSDRVVGLSLWDSPTDADATAPTFGRHMAAVADLLAAPPAPAALRVVASAGAGVSA